MDSFVMWEKLYKLATKGKPKKNIGFIIAQNGTRLDVRFQRLSESGSKMRNTQRRSGSGIEALQYTPSGKASGTEDIYEKVNPRSTEAVDYQQKVSRATSQLTVLLFGFPWKEGNLWLVRG